MSTNYPVGYFTKCLAELRRRLIGCLVVLAIFFVGFYLDFKPVYQLIVRPLIVSLPQGSKIITSHISASFMAPIQIATYLSIFCGSPWIFYQVWRFIAPGLYPKEKRMVLKMTFLSLILFLLGAVFAYLVVFPLLFRVFVNLVPPGVSIMADMSSCLQFTFSMLLIFGLAFQTPVIINLLVNLNIVSKTSLKYKRKWLAIIILIISMILTPPDVMSMLMLALPLYLLFEIGLWLAKD